MIGYLNVRKGQTVSLEKHDEIDTVNALTFASYQIP